MRIIFVRIKNQKKKGGAIKKYGKVIFQGFLFKFNLNVKYHCLLVTTYFINPFIQMHFKWLLPLFTLDSLFLKAF